MIEYLYIVRCPNCEDEQFSLFDDAKCCAMGCISSKPIITQVEITRNDFGECTDSYDLGTVWSWEDAVDRTDDEPATTFSKADFTTDYDPDNDPEFQDDDFFAVNTEEVLTEGYREFELSNQITKEELYDCLVKQGNLVIVNIGDRGEIGVRFNDGSRYSDSELTIDYDEVDGFSIYEWFNSDDGDHTDGDYSFETKSFDELWDELKNFIPELLVECGTRKPVPDGMTIEQLVEEMEENEDTVECVKCGNLVEKTSCHHNKEGFGWCCADCESADSLAEYITDTPEELPENTELYYPELTVDVAGEFHPATWTDPGWSEDASHTDDYSYFVDTNILIGFIYDNLLKDEDIPDGRDTLNDNTVWKKFWIANLDKLIDKYENEILKHFETDAAEDAYDDFQERYDRIHEYDMYDEPDPDYAYELWRDEH